MFDFSVKNKLYSLLMRKADRVIQRNLKEVTLSAISRDSVWFYSQMKSGTTYTIIFLINYLNLVSKKGFTSKDVYEILPYFHSINAAIDRTSVSKIREEQRRLIEGVTNKYFLHTHDQIIDFSEKRVLLNRNPLDYLVSSYYFWYVNRGKKDSIEDVYKRILDRYIINYNNHERILKEQPNTTLSIMYEELIRKPELIFTQLVNFLGYEYDSGLLTEAVELSQKKKIKEKTIDNFLSTYTYG